VWANVYSDGMPWSAADLRLAQQSSGHSEEFVVSPLFGGVRCRNDGTTVEDSTLADAGRPG
jgi:hypothetical protein